MKRNFLTLFLAGLSLAASAQQRPNWQNLDLKTDSIFGISTDKAYCELLKNKKPQRVTVAVIDAGVDTAHEDLVPVLWQNPKKQRGDNGTFGWSYLGSAKGNVHYDNLELTRQVRQAQQKGDTTSAIYRTAKAALDAKLVPAQRALQGISGFRSILEAMVKKMAKTAPTLADFKAFQPSGPGETQVQQTMLKVLSQGGDYAPFKASQLDGPIAHYREQVDYTLNIAFDPRAELVGDDYFNSAQRNYGTPDNNGPDPTHGTHVSGIIGAVRGNGLSLDGIADNVRIINIRAVPDGDERDKDIANAIRYATDHGARVINMSFGKDYSQDKGAVDEAVRYALKKDVLLIQAAGNDNKNIDSVAQFPTRKFLNGNEAGAWIVVGASGLKDDAHLKASFSNYGKNSVDVFAPGVQIYSTIPGSKYDYFDGTSMAAPVVAGLATLIREYYPKLKAEQVKEIILNSVVKVDHPVTLKTGKAERQVAFTELCQTGGIVNAYNALKLAATY